MVEVAAPRQGAAKILMILARMAAADWIDGVVEVWVRPDGAGTTIEVLLDDGLSVTRLRPALRVRAPYDEFQKAIEVRASAVEPLALVSEIDAEGFDLRAQLWDAPASSGTMDVVDGEILKADRALRAAVSIRGAAPRGAGAVSIRGAPKSVRPGPKSARPGPKSVRPGPKSVTPGPKSVKPGPKSVKPAPKSVKPAPPRPEPPKPGGSAGKIPLPPPVPRRPAPSDVKATVRRDASVAGPLPAPPNLSRAPSNVKATVKVDAFSIPKEALREVRKPPPLPAAARKNVEAPPIRRDDEEE